MYDSLIRVIALMIVVMFATNSIRFRSVWDGLMLTVSSLAYIIVLISIGLLINIIAR